MTSVGFFAGLLISLSPTVFAAGQTERITYDICERAFRQAVEHRTSREPPIEVERRLRFAVRQCEDCREALRPAAGLERTLGHAYYLLGDLPRAIVAYRRGLRLDPSDRMLEAALALARSRVEYPSAFDLAALMQPERDYWPGWLSLSRLGLLAFAAYTAMCFAITRWQMTRRRRWLWLAGSASVVAFVPAIGSGVEWLRRERDVLAPVVVLARAEPLRMGNGLEYPPRFDAALPRGAEVRLLFERNGWFQVELSGGVVGWLPSDAVVTDE